MTEENTPTRYQEFLTYVFDRPVTDSKTKSEWYFLVDENFTASDSEIVELYSYFLRNCGRDLESYSDAQVNLGINYLFNNCCSDLMYSLRDGQVEEDKKIQALQNIKYLYKDCFELRCAPVLGYIDEPGGTPLNQACYMLWDITPINYIPKEQQESRREYITAIIGALEGALYLSNDACIESALHGLGHMILYYQKQITPVIDAFLEKRSDIRPELKQYAQNAKVGYVN